MRDNNLMRFCKDISTVVDIKGKIRKICVSVLPAAAIITFASTVMYWNSRDYGLVLAYAGREIGTVQDENVFEKAAQLFQEQIVSNKNIDTAIPSPECKLTMLNSSGYVSPGDVKDKLLQQSQAAVEKAFGLYIDGKLIGIVKSRELLEDLLKNILQNAKDGNTEATAEFTGKTEIFEGLYLSSEICDINCLNKALSLGIESETDYIVQPGDTLESIAEKFNTSKTLICENNNISNEKIHSGQNLSIIYINKIAHVKVCKNQVSETEIPHTSSTFENPNDYTGTNKVAQAGKNGLRRVTEKIIYIDGKEVSRESVEDINVLQPIEERISIGTKKKEIPKSQSGFCWPVPFTRNITSGYGPRDGAFHRGIDIAASGVGGKEIVAVAEGTVEVVSNGGGYGNFLIIRHNNNTCTLYAHCSLVTVKSGQKVAQGQKVALVGSTGNSTGNHLHFEVIINDKKVNPIEFLR